MSKADIAPTIFYSWQADIKPSAACRGLIRDALNVALASIAADGVVDEAARIDQDTEGVPGSPDIAATIFAKIQAASVFVADVTIVGSYGDRPTPNPNVLVELGYAFHALGDARVILVQNGALGAPKDLPFDLKLRRVMQYSSAPDDRDRARPKADLARKLEVALRASLGEPVVPKTSPIMLTLTFVRLPNSTGGLHHYELRATIKNVGTRRIDDWMIEVEFPTTFLEPGVIHGARVANRSNSDTTVFRFTGDHFPLHRGDSRALTLGYRIDDALYRAHRDSLATYRVTASASVDGAVEVEEEKSLAELNEF